MYKQYKICDYIIYSQNEKITIFVYYFNMNV